jgi:hypothetical protein
MFGLNYVVTCRKDGVKAHVQRFGIQEKAEEAATFWRENGANIVWDDERKHVTFDSVEVAVFETVYDIPSRKGGAA